MISPAILGAGLGPIYLECDGDSRMYGAPYLVHGVSDPAVLLRERVALLAPGSGSSNRAISGSLGGHPPYGSVTSPGLHRHVFVLLTGTNGYSGTANGGVPMTGAEVYAVISAVVDSVIAAGVPRIVVATDYVTSIASVLAGNELVRNGFAGRARVADLAVLHYLDTSLFPDTTHPNAQGAEAIVSLLYPAVISLFS